MTIDVGLTFVIGYGIVFFVGILSTLVSIFTEPDFPEPAKVVKTIPKVSDNFLEGMVLFNEDDNFRFT